MRRARLVLAVTVAATAAGGCSDEGVREFEQGESAWISPHQGGGLAWLADTLNGREIMPRDVVIGARFVDASYSDDHAVVRWSRDGRWLRVFGGKGDGPGELRRPFRVHQYGDSLVVGVPGRVDVLAPDGSLVRRAGLGYQEFCDGWQILLYCGALDAKSLVDRIVLDGSPAATQVGHFLVPDAKVMRSRLAPVVLSDSLVTVFDIADAVLYVLPTADTVQRERMLPRRWVQETRAAHEKEYGGLGPAVIFAPFMKGAARLDESRLLLLGVSEKPPSAWLADVHADEARPVLARPEHARLAALLRAALIVRPVDDGVLLVTRDTAAIVSIR